MFSVHSYKTIQYNHYWVLKSHMYIILMYIVLIMLIMYFVTYSKQLLEMFWLHYLGANNSIYFYMQFVSFKHFNIFQ